MAGQLQGQSLTAEPMTSRGKKRASNSSLGISQPFLKPLQHPSVPVSNHRPAFQIPSLPSQTTSQSQIQRSHVSKIAIPRLRRDSDVGSGVGSSKGVDKHRVSHACEPCRHRKTKCSGERPICKHCEDFKIACVYADGKRDRVKKEFGTMAGKLEEYERLLRDLSVRVDEPDQILISKAIEKEVTPEEDDLRTEGGSIVSAYTRLEEADGTPEGETQVSAGVGSTGSLDRIEEDFNRNASTRATGFMGKNSEVSWLRSLKNQTENIPPGVHGDMPNGKHTLVDRTRDSHDTDGARPVGSSDAVPLSESTYHCDDITVLVPGQVDLYEIPPKQTADALFRNYMETVHPAFPIIGKLTFSGQFRTFFERTQKPGDNWLAILNLIFAIGAKYSHLVQAEWRGDERDHLLYFTRARLLALNSDSILAHPDLQQVQVAGLMSFYLLAINQINRAWILSGIAVRYGISLGLNLRNDNRKMLDTSKEIRYRVWWSLSSTEHALAVMAGRPTSISDTDCTVPLPVAVEEESFPTGSGGKLYGETSHRTPRSSTQDSLSPDRSTSTPSSTSSGMKTTPASSTSPLSQQSSFESFKPVPTNSAMYFVHHTQLSNLSQEVCRCLYSPTTMAESWARIQSLIGTLNDKLEGWRSNLPSLFDFTKKQRDQQFIRQRMNLGFFYYSVETLINRPCLCRIDRRIPNESSRSKEFNRFAATKCVHAAKGMLNLIPDEPNPVGLYKVAPWWCLLHYLMQAATVLMLELAIRADHMPFEAEEIVNCGKKAVRWLNKMSEESLAAQRAWKICHEMLIKVAARVGRDVHDLSGYHYGSQEPSDGDQYMTSPPVLASHHASRGHHLFDPSQFTVQFTNQTSYGEGEPPEHTSIFHPSVYTLHDEFFPYDGSTNGVYEHNLGSMFPSSGQIDAMGEGVYVADEMFYGICQPGPQSNGNG